MSCHDGIAACDLRSDATLDFGGRGVGYHPVVSCFGHLKEMIILSLYRRYTLNGAKGLSRLTRLAWLSDQLSESDGDPAI